MRTGIQEAFSLLAQAGIFFGRHYPVIARFCIPVALQRFVAVGDGERFASLGALAAGPAGELTTAAFRLGLLVWLVSRSFRGAEVSRSELAGRFAESVQANGHMLLATAGVLVLFAIVANGIPAIVRSGLGEASRKSALAWELGIKTLTVIPFAMVWTVVVARVVLGRGITPGA